MTRIQQTNYKDLQRHSIVNTARQCALLRSVMAGLPSLVPGVSTAIAQMYEQDWGLQRLQGILEHRGNGRNACHTSARLPKKFWLSMKQVHASLSLRGGDVCGWVGLNPGGLRDLDGQLLQGYLTMEHAPNSVRSGLAYSDRHRLSALMNLQTDRMMHLAVSGSHFHFVSCPPKQVDLLRLIDQLRNSVVVAFLAISEHGVLRQITAPDKELVRIEAPPPPKQMRLGVGTHVLPHNAVPSHVPSSAPENVTHTSTKRDTAVRKKAPAPVIVRRKPSSAVGSKSDDAAFSNTAHLTPFDISTLFPVGTDMSTVQESATAAIPPPGPHFTLASDKEGAEVAYLAEVPGMGVGVFFKQSMASSDYFMESRGALYQIKGPRRAHTARTTWLQLMIRMGLGLTPKPCAPARAGMSTRDFVMPMLSLFPR